MTMYYDGFSQEFGRLNMGGECSRYLTTDGTDTTFDTIMRQETQITPELLW
jgi:hypothetical protein